MLITQYSLSGFLARQRGVPFVDLLIEINAEIKSVESKSHSVKGAIRQRNSGSLQYTAKLRSLLNLLYMHTKPGGLTQFQLLEVRPLVHEFVATGDLPSTVLAVFNEAHLQA